MDPTRDTLRWGVIGTGDVSAQFVPDINHSSSAVAAAVCSRTLARAREFADLHAIPTAYDDVAALLEDGSVDIVYIATPHGTHHDLGVAALDAGKHVLIEKPMALNTGEVRSLIDAARRNGRFLMEAMWMKYNPAITDLRLLLHQGRIGEVRSLRASFGAPFPLGVGSRWNAELGGSALLDQGIYTVTLARMLLGEPAKIDVSSTSFTPGVDQTEWMTFHYSTGRFAQLSSSMVEWIEPSASVNGTRGWMRLDVPFWASRSLSISAGDGLALEHETREYEIHGNGFVPMIDAVGDALRSGWLEHPSHPLSETLATFTLLDEIRTHITSPQRHTAAMTK